MPSSKVIPWPYCKSSKSNGWNFKPDRRGGPCLSRLVEEVFWERWSFEVLLKLQRVGSHELCLYIGPALLTAFYQISHHLILQDVATPQFICCCQSAVNGYWPRSGIMCKSVKSTLPKAQRGSFHSLLLSWERKHVLILVYTVRLQCQGSSLASAAHIMK